MASDADWKEIQLGDVIELKRGYDLPKDKRIVGDVPIVSSSGVSDFHVKAMVKGPGVVTGRYGTIGEVFYISEDYWPLNTTLYVRDFKGNDPKFISYLLKTLDFQAYSDKGAVPGLNRNHLHLASVRIPCESAQKSIAKVLGDLDSKIDINRRINQTLEAMAQAIFKSWFIDFDPIKAKIAAIQEGRDPLRAAMSAVSGKTDDELDALQLEQYEQLAKTAALFPDNMYESELGRIPKGWSAARIQDSVEGVYDGPHATPPEATEGAVFLGIRNMTGTSLDMSDIRYISEADWSQWTRRVEPRMGDIVFSYEATLGYFALLPSNLRCCLGRRLALIRPHADQGYGSFWFHQFVAAPFQRFLEQHTIPGATVNRIALKDFPSYPVLKPAQAVQAKFCEKVDPIWSLIHANQSQSKMLAKLRDTLLPKLLSGELTVSALTEPAGAE